jgi:hypothetical protein
MSFVRSLAGRTAAVLPRRYENRVRGLFGAAPVRARRRRVPDRLGIDGLCRGMRERGVRHVVLRWFEDLPQVRPGGDLDLLIEDSGVAATRDLFDDSGEIPCDLYSVSGLPGTDYRGMPYLPPRRADELLADARQTNRGFMVPSPEHHFLSLAFDAVYHKGLRSGLPTSNSRLRPEPQPKHDYAGVLARLARQLGLNVEITMEGLDRELTRRCWRPSARELGMLAGRNEWLKGQRILEQSTSAGVSQ